MNLKKLGEFGFIRNLALRQSTLQSHSGGVGPALPKSLRVGIGDDTCVWTPTPGCDLLSTGDALVENIHFNLKTTSPWQLGAKSLATGLSHIAAKDGLPRYYLVSLAIPKRRGLAHRYVCACHDA